MIFYILNFKEEMDILKTKLMQDPPNLLTGYTLLDLGIGGHIFQFFMFEYASSEYAWRREKRQIQH